VKRRRFLTGGSAAATASLLSDTAVIAVPAALSLTLPAPAFAAGPLVRPDYRLNFPRDFGAHPEYRTEWWYATGWLRAGSSWIGMQLTFFRSRTLHNEQNPSRFAPRQLILAHAAIALESEGKLRHDQRAAREGFTVGNFSDRDTEVNVLGWSLRRTPEDRYLTSIKADGFGLELTLTPNRPPLLQGRQGYSRKGPKPAQASHYYSRPQLQVSGQIRIDNRTTAEAGPQEGNSSMASQASSERLLPVDGLAWLDHEWSSEYLDPDAAGWDWCGLNLEDGSALMAFRIRRHDGSTLWSDAKWVDAQGREQRSEDKSINAQQLEAQDRAAQFAPRRHWHSLRSGARYPVAMRLQVAGRTLDLEPLFNDQELDTRASTGTIYWEGAVKVLEQGRLIGRGYMELTGYAGALKM
jgi:predicted secreted hydrolase